MKVDECRATVFLHEPLRRSLAMWLGGKEVASMQRCALGVGHLVSTLGFPIRPAGAGFAGTNVDSTLGLPRGATTGRRGERL
jgi:hypothetical protein